MSTYRWHQSRLSAWTYIGHVGMLSSALSLVVLIWMALLWKTWELGLSMTDALFGVGLLLVSWGLVPLAAPLYSVVEVVDCKIQVRRLMGWKAYRLDEVLEFRRISDRRAVVDVRGETASIAMTSVPPHVLDELAEHLLRSGVQTVEDRRPESNRHTHRKLGV